MTPPNAHETGIVRLLVREKQDRFLTLIQSAKGRRKILDSLAHFRDFEPRYIVSLRANEQTESAIVSELQKRGAPDSCYLFAYTRHLDRNVVQLEDGVQEALSDDCGVILSSLPGVLAFFNGEDPNDRYLVFRP